MYGVVGAGCALWIVFACASSTPVMGVIVVVIGYLMFPMRRQMKLVCLSSVIALFLLHMVMQAPVWHLVSRIDVVGGSTGCVEPNEPIEVRSASK